VAAFDVSTDAPETGAAVRFDAADSDDPDGVIVSYEWDFDGDGDTDATGASAEVTHAYEAGGTFEASLTVVDSFGATNTTTRSVDVATGPTPTVTTTPTATTTPTETETPTPTATATDTVTPTGMGDSSRTPATTPFGSSFPWWLPGGLIVAGVALYVARRWRDGRR
jgi:PKD repeat protein